MPAPSLRITSVLYQNDMAAALRGLRSLAHSASLAREAGVISEAALHIGDSSPSPLMDAAAVEALQEELAPLIGRVEYLHFNANLGSAGGQNRLSEGMAEDLWLVMNPDVVAHPRLASALVGALGEGVGITEARQLPLEHPKVYDARTGDTSWASGCCMLTRRELREKLGGFDSETFFLYCDDVDYSWRVRDAGWRVVYCPDARVFHDKRVDDGGGVAASSTEHYYSAEAGLLLRWKWSRDDLLEQQIRRFSISPSEAHRRALEEFRHRRDAGRLPARFDPEHRTAQFVGGEYAVHRV